MSIAAVIGARLKAARERTGTRQIDLLPMAGIPQSTLSQWEQGIRSTQLERIEAAMIAMGCDPMELVTGDTDLTEREIELLDLYRRSDPMVQEIVTGILKARLESPPSRMAGGGM